MTSNSLNTHAYLKISDDLRSRIESGLLKPGDKFPTERQLVEEFDVARMTIRHALGILEDDGLIDRRRGRSGGTFVRVIPPVVQLGAPISIERQLEQDGHRASTRQVSVETRDVPGRLAPLLGLERGSQVWFLRRLRLYDGEVVSLMRHYLPVERYPDIADLDLDGPLYKSIITKHESVVPVMPTGIQQELLGVTRTQPLVRLGRIIYNPAGEPIDYVEEFVHTDKMSLQIWADVEV
ncbi:hypothetical protein CPHO_03135 [Corynebacterium phocae]|uniref:HTH gntR-type domain-containing protein n=1 Tax=Corynebacterium phocae TaxID=161895 RepID=A0A1L7D261_9CORY|nr:GntR family transcriptional regulator [Corynebacterium phocae]APT92051.1 hypothetical protein CPHO_03135 [Corynebacterium phocae]